MALGRYSDGSVSGSEWKNSCLYARNSSSLRQAVVVSKVVKFNEVWHPSDGYLSRQNVREYLSEVSD